MLVDTTIWVDYLNGIVNPKTDYLHRAILNDEIVYITPTIVQEVLQGIRDDKEYKITKTYLTNFDIILLDQVEAATAAAELYRGLRKKGVTVRKSNDCLIAHHAIFYSIPILHNDIDFTNIVKHTSLKEVQI